MYGPVPAVAGVGLEVPEGEIRAILGANGAGKSSTIKAILGLLKTRAGTVEFQVRPIHGLPRHRIHQLDIARDPEGTRSQYASPRASACTCTSPRTRPRRAP